MNFKWWKKKLKFDFKIVVVPTLNQDVRVDEEEMIVYCRPEVEQFVINCLKDPKFPELVASMKSMIDNAEKTGS